MVALCEGEARVGARMRDPTPANEALLFLFVSPPVRAPARAMWPYHPSGTPQHDNRAILHESPQPRHLERCGATP